MKLFERPLLTNLFTLLLVSFSSSSCALFSRDTDVKMTSTSIIEVPSEPEASGKKIEHVQAQTTENAQKTKKEIPAHQNTQEKNPVAEAKDKRQAESSNQVNTNHIVALPKSTVEIHGDSTMRKYVSRATKIGVRVAVTPPIGQLENLLKEKVSEFILLIPVSDLKSGTELLDEHLLEAMKAKEFPEIRGVLKNYKLEGKQNLTKTKVLASVELTVAGVTKLVPVEATVSLEDKTVRVRGEKQILMTDFNITPPTMMFGTITTADAVTIKFDFYLELK
jgi:hypothetical protein